MEYVWYACYGSNLSSERFKCYIQGGTCKENNKTYRGCTDKTLWTESKIRCFPGKMHFGQNSPSWDYSGVAFYDPKAGSETIMRLYKITNEQLVEIQKQEGKGDYWYGNKLDLGIEEDGCHIYTLTNVLPVSKNSPADCYLTLIRNALVDECGLSRREADNYLSGCLE